MLHSHRNGVEQIGEILSGQKEIDALHLITHGTKGAVKLGNTWLSNANLQAYSSRIAGWSVALRDAGDLLLYGCDLAGTEDGKSFVHSLASVSGADVAVSSDKTGWAGFHADWDLEFHTGKIETQIAISDQLQAKWQVLLAPLTFSTTNDVVNGNTTSIANLIASDGGDGISFREAIIAANNTAGTDDIFFSAPGSYAITIGNPAMGEDFSATGDLDIRDSLAIHGVAGGGVTIDASGMTANRDRVFDIIAGNVVFNDLTIQGGDGGGSGGGAAAVRSGSSLTINNSLVTNNVSNNGGALENEGTFTATFTTFSGNSANNGGAIDNSGTLNLSDVAITANTASNAGGGLRNNGDAQSIKHVTFSGNSANQGGAIHNGGGLAQMSLSNVIVSGNKATTEGGGIWTNQNINTIHVTIASNNVSTAVTGLGGGVLANGGGNLTMLNSILDGNTAALGPNANRALATSGYNISDATAIPTPTAGDRVGVDPLLSALASNGGYTQTHALQAGSSAISNGTALDAPTTDQRGYARNDATDIGAFEFTSANTPPTITSNGVDQHR